MENGCPLDWGKKGGCGLPLSKVTPGASRVAVAILASPLVGSRKQPVPN